MDDFASRPIRTIVLELTLMWVVTIPGGLLFVTVVLHWPIDFVIALYLPISLTLVPISYPLAIAGQRARRGHANFLQFARPTIIIRIAGFTLLLGLAAMYVAIAYRVQSIGGMIGAGAISLGAYLGAMRAWWSVVVHLRERFSGSDSDQESEGGVALSREADGK